MGESPSDALLRLGLKLPPAPTPVGAYAPVVSDGHYAWVSGQVALSEGQVLSPGLVGRDLDVAAAQGLARQATLQALSALSRTLGSLEAIRQIARVIVYVAAIPGLARVHEVANGSTELLIAVFGERGRPARTTVGVAGLPLNAPVEVELTAVIG